jgi:UDP-glucose 4-epimerase
MKLVVTGGAGYIGSVMAAYFLEAGHQVIVIDNLSRGFRDAVPKGARFIQADISDIAKVVYKKDKIEAVVHLAAFAYVGESVEKPDLYWQNNVVGTLKLLAGMRRLNIKKLVFASTCATYGVPLKMPITEDMPARPINPYGMTKLAMDMAITSEAEAYGLGATSLRFFNVAGAYKGFGERHNPETHIIPQVLAAAAGEEKYFSIFGDDYDTPDGSCVRDYIHVVDLAEAAVLALQNQKPCRHNIYNLGNSNSFSNKQVVTAAQKVTGRKIAVRIGARRPGDPPNLIGSSQKIKKELGWQPSHPKLDEMIASAWQFYQTRHR